MKSIFLKDRSTKAIPIKQNIRYKTKQNIRYKTKFNPISINGLNLYGKWLGISNDILKVLVRFKDKIAIIIT